MCEVFLMNHSLGIFFKNLILWKQIFETQINSRASDSQNMNTGKMWSFSLMKKYKLAAVAVDSLECSTVGRYVIISKMSFVSSKIYLGL